MAFFGLFGSPNIEKLKAKRNVSGLNQALSYRGSSRIRRAAAVAPLTRPNTCMGTIYAKTRELSVWRNNLPILQDGER